MGVPFVDFLLSMRGSLCVCVFVNVHVVVCLCVCLFECMIGGV